MEFLQKGLAAASKGIEALQKKARGTDARFFSATNSKGETGELKTELASPDIDVVKDAVKKVIAGLTVGKDMSAVFADVLNCIRIENLEVKKLVYLYLINYAKSQPDMAILAVNSFVRDTEHPNPLIRALAVRTMGAIRVDKITEYLGTPLKRALADEDPYVRKTAAICVAKLHDISPSMVRDQGFLDLLRELLSDANPAVVANAVAALSEIQDQYPGRPVFEVSPATLAKLLAALNETTEWGQVYILDALAKLYTPADGREAESIVERVVPRLTHQNSAVVLSAVKVVLLYMAQISNEETLANYRRKLAPPLVTLAQSAQPEIQYVALRNISLVVQRDAALLASKIKVFFCKYNDPIYVKMEKLDILVRLANDRNVEQVLLELKEYAQEVDVEYVRRAVRTIGRCAIKLDVAAEKCIKVLLQLIQTKVNYVVQEAIVVIKDIFRTYPNRYESIIGVLCEALDTLDEPEAKASMIWILGEYADRIENAGELLEREFVDSFHDETPAVQLALLTACVKLFLKKPDTSEELVQRVLHMATEDSDNPDLRDRGYIYWRLLSSDPDAAKAVVLAEKPPIHDSTNTLEPALLSSLLANMSSLASVYHKAPESFIKRPRGAGVFDADEADEEEDFASDEEGDGAAAGGAGAAGARAGARAPAAPAAPAAAAAAVDDLDILGMGSSPAPAMPAPVAPTAVAGGIGIDDLLGDLGGGSASAPAPVSRPSPLSHPVVGEASGLKVHAAVVLGADGASPVLEMGIENGQASAVDKVAVALNRNAAGLAPVAAAADFSGVRPGAQGVTSVALKFDATKVLAGSDTVDVALRDNTSRVQVMFKVPLGLEALFGADGEAEKLHFPVEWPALSGPDAEVAAVVREVASTDLDAVSARLRRANVFHAARRSGAGGMEMEYVAARVHAAPGSALDGAVVFAELTFKAGVPMIKLVVKARAPGVAKLGWDALARLLATA